MRKRERDEGEDGDEEEEKSSFFLALVFSIFLISHRDFSKFTTINNSGSEN